MPDVPFRRELFTDLIMYRRRGEVGLFTMPMMKTLGDVGDEELRRGIR